MYVKVESICRLESGVVHSHALTILVRLLVFHKLPFPVHAVRCHAHATIEYFRVD